MSPEGWCGAHQRLVNFNNTKFVCDPSVATHRAHLMDRERALWSSILATRCFNGRCTSENLVAVSRVQLEENGLTVSLQPCRQALFAYGGKEPLPLAGKFAVPTTVNGVTLDTTFVVIQGEGEILLGRKSPKAFGILTLPTAENIVYSTHEDVKAAVQRKFPKWNPQGL